MLNRREFTTLAGASLGSLLTQKLWAEQTRATHSSDKFYFALVADTHIIDDFYVKGSENGVEDNESILVTTPRFASARDLINSLHPAIEQVFLIGDYFHNYPSTEYDFYFQHTTRLDNAKAISDQFKMPVSTTHVLSSGIAGTMMANGSGLQLATIRNIALAWVFTLPVAALLAGGIFWGLRQFLH